MRKKTLLIPTLMALFCGTIGSGPAAFAETDIYGTRYWSVPELLALNAEVEAEMGPDCAADALCADEYRWGLVNRGGEYWALQGLMSSPFVVASANPDEGTIKVLYNDKSPDFYINSSRDPKVRLPHEFFVFWTEFGTENDPGMSLENIIFHANLKHDENKAVAGVHELIGWDEERMGYFPTGGEAEFMIGDSAFAENYRGHIYFSIDSTWIGASIYADCINNAAFKKNTECQAVYGENMQATYIPVGGIDEELTPVEEPTPFEGPTTIDEPEITIEDPESLNLEPEPATESSTPTPETEETAQAVAALEAKPTIVTVNSTKEIQNEPVINTTTEDQPGNDEVEIPLAGGAMSCTSEKPAFPWWLMVLLIIGDLLLVWWFAPTSNGNRKNRQKM